jgi:hypothetical protein
MFTTIDASRNDCGGSGGNYISYCDSGSSSSSSSSGSSSRSGSSSSSSSKIGRAHV